MDYQQIAERYGLTLLPLKQESVAFMELAPADSARNRPGDREAILTGEAAPGAARSDETARAEAQAQAEAQASDQNQTETPASASAQAHAQAEARRGAEVIRQLRDREGYGHLVFLTAVDYPEKGLFRLSYMLHNFGSTRDICLLVYLERENPVMESIHTLWAQGATYQRELKEMYGIDFPGSPDLDLPFILEGWKDIPPMRRDFDTKAYSEKTYFPRPGRSTKDPERVMREALYPDGERR